MKILIKKLLNAAAISIAGWTILSTLLYGISRPERPVALFNPFGMQWSGVVTADGHTTYINIMIFATSLVFYALFGMAFVLIPWVFKNEKWGLTKATLISFGATVGTFMLSVLLTYMPYGAGNDFFAFWWFGFTSDITRSVFGPLLIIFVGYLIVWISSFIYYRRELKKLNLHLG
ncbi:MAG: DUF3021 domain-containing protein [Streptococcaceae bacterium]|jgi:hypothetical protein|nr:DUF3021 domain-containing protein [Streptococcaceae bacterium]